MATVDIPGYELHEAIGGGGMGVVYRATHRKLGKTFAVKVIHAHLADPTILGLFEREVKIAGMLDHPNVVNVTDAGDVNGVPYLVMELLKGEPLSKRLARGAIPYSEAIRIACQVLDGLDAAHGKHIIHRDIKPQNIWLSEDGGVKVLDFGIARALNLSVNSLSAGGYGTAGYMSPEQLLDEEVDERSDLYAVGCLLFEMISGGPPYTGKTANAVNYKHMHEPVPRLGPASPSPVAEAIERAMAKLPAHRYASAATMRQAVLRALATPTPVQTAGAPQMAVTPRLPTVPVGNTQGAPKTADAKKTPLRQPAWAPIPAVRTGRGRVIGISVACASLLGFGAFMMIPRPNSEAPNLPAYVDPKPKDSPSSSTGVDKRTPTGGGARRGSSPPTPAPSAPKLVKENRTIPFTTSRRMDPSRAEGTRTKQQSGIEGLEEVTYSVAADGKRSVAGRRSIRPMRPEIIVIGTRAPQTTTPVTEPAIRYGFCPVCGKKFRKGSYCVKDGVRV